MRPIRQHHSLCELVDINANTTSSKQSRSFCQHNMSTTKLRSSFPRNTNVHHHQSKQGKCHTRAGKVVGFIRNKNYSHTFNQRQVMRKRKKKCGVKRTYHRSIQPQGSCSCRTSTFPRSRLNHGNLDAKDEPSDRVKRCTRLRRSVVLLPKRNRTIYSTTHQSQQKVSGKL